MKVESPTRIDFSSPILQTMTSSLDTTEILIQYVLLRGQLDEYVSELASKRLLWKSYRLKKKKITPNYNHTYLFLFELNNIFT